jgi:hypothetical protein
MAKIYWRTIKRGTRKFTDCPKNLQDEIKELAKQDVADGTITKEAYLNYIGEEYSA